MNCIVYTPAHSPLSARMIQHTVAKVLTGEKNPDGLVSVHVIGDTRMRRLNAQYRGQDRTTDVLSFSAREGGGPVSLDNEVGDIFISAPQIARQAKAFGVSVREEFTRMLVHGVLHALGYDHITEAEAKSMFAKQEKYVTKFFR